MTGPTEQAGQDVGNKGWVMPADNLKTFLAGHGVTGATDAVILVDTPDDFSVIVSNKNIGVNLRMLAKAMGELSNTLPPVAAASDQVIVSRLDLQAILSITPAIAGDDPAAGAAARLTDAAEAGQ